VLGARRPGPRAPGAREPFTPRQPQLVPEAQLQTAVMESQTLITPQTRED
jgi:hypothetical protein